MSNHLHRIIQPGAKHGIGLALLLALLVAVIVLVVAPSPVPAADTTNPEISAAATPLAVDSEATIEPDDPCATVTPDESASDLVTSAEDLVPASTPIAANEDEPERCDELTATVTPEAPTLPDPVQPNADGTSTPVAAPIIDPALIDPFVNGLPAIEDEQLPSSDPFDIGLPLVVATESPAVDPFETGLPIPDSTIESPISVPTPEIGEDPSFDGMPDPALADPMLAGTDLVSQVDVVVTGISVSGVTTPGGTISYRFRVTNPGSSGVVIDLVATTNLTGWEASIVSPVTNQPLAELLTLDAGGDLEVLVTVTAPLDASIGDQVVTALTATIQP